MAERCAVIGIGQTKYSRCRRLTIDGLVREAALRALEDAERSFADIDAVVIGKAPDALEGVMMPELSLCDALGAVGKPIHRVHTAGSVGASTAISAATLVESGMYECVLTVAYEKQSDGDFMWALSGGRSGSLGAGGSFAPWIREYIRRSGAPEHIGLQVALKDRANGLKNPYAHLRMEAMTLDEARESPMLWEPLRFLEVCPSSDGAAAMVMTNAAGAGKTPRPPAWVIAHSKRTEFAVFPGRDPVKPAAGVECARELYRKAGITDPRRQIDCAELYVPFSWFEPMWLEGHLICDEGQGWRMVEFGRNRTRRRLSGEHVGRRSVLEPDRRIRHDSMLGGGQSGPWHRRRLPGRRGACRPGPCLRRRVELLCDVDREFGSESGVQLET